MEHFPPMHCPLCQIQLSDDAAQCTQCDWVRGPVLPRSRKKDWCAAALSFVPGLGHLYKGHWVPGLFLLCVVGPAFLVVVMLLVPVTYGLSLILPAVFIAFTAVHAFHLREVRTYPEARQRALHTLAQWSRQFARWRSHGNRATRAG
jgi:hypothetical protein